ncbi:MAG: histidine--tRNA ligase, partial [Bacilli bacterium]|nr:histidine--tRNA ligase [Bacilli bacterium]
MKDVEIRNVKGTFDYLPKEQLVRNYVTNILTEVFERFGYLPAVTPTLCYYDVLASKYGGGAEILKEVYKLTDQGERDLALRYDLTVPFAKLISLTKDLNLPFKRYEIGKVFRDGPVKVGRNREFIQCDVDVVGVRDVYIDAELISLYVMVFSRLQLSCTVDYNNRKLMTGLLMECGVNDEQMVSVITVIDKFKKLSKEEIEKEFLNCGITTDQIERLYTYFNLGFEGIKQEFLNTNNEMIQKGIDELTQVSSYLESLGVSDVVNIDLTLARGLNIYTGTVF